MQIIILLPFDSEGYESTQDSVGLKDWKFEGATRGSLGLCQIAIRDQLNPFPRKDFAGGGHRQNLQFRFPGSP